jgi:hypothetical protein
LPELVEAIRQIKSDSIGPYLDYNRHAICEGCSHHNSSQCPCPMDYLAVLLVEAMESIDPPSAYERAAM